MLGSTGPRAGEADDEPNGRARSVVGTGYADAGFELGGRHTGDQLANIASRADSAAREGMVLRLQHEHGNTYVQRVLAHNVCLRQPADAADAGVDPDIHDADAPSAGVPGDPGSVASGGSAATVGPRPLDFVTMKRKDIELTGADKYGHWWTEVDGSESYGWWPKYPVGGIADTLLGVEGELNGQTSFGGSATTDPHHGDSAPDTFHPGLTNGKSDATVKTEIRSYASSYSGEWRWTFGFGQNCHTFQKSMMSAVGLDEP
jgi:hypothetical protein